MLFVLFVWLCCCRFGCFLIVLGLCVLFLCGCCLWVEFYCFGIRFGCCIGVGLLGVLDDFVFGIARVCSGFGVVCCGYGGMVLFTLFSFGVCVFDCWIGLFWWLGLVLYLIVCWFDFV